MVEYAQNRFKDILRIRREDEVTLLILGKRSADFFNRQYRIGSGLVSEVNKLAPAHAGNKVWFKSIVQGCRVGLALPQPLAKHRRRGIAAVLLEGFMAEARARGAEQMLLEVRESNIPAIRLYERYGFTAYNKRKNYYRNPAEDAVLMVV